MPSMSMGSSNSSTNTSQNTETHAVKEPWGPTVAPLTSLIGLLGGQIPHYEQNRHETEAYHHLMNQLAQRDDNWRQAQQFTNRMYEMGGRHGFLQNQFDTYDRRVSPYAEGEHLGPDGSNPLLNDYLNVNADDVSNRVNQMFAGAGRDLSGAHMNAYAQGISEANSPILAQQYNTDVQRQIQAAQDLLAASQATAAARQQAGGTAMNAAQQAAYLKAAGRTGVLALQDAKRGAPIGNLVDIIKPMAMMAQLGGTVDSETEMTGTSSTSGSSMGFGMGGK